MICPTPLKEQYDTEFEATVGAAHATRDFGSEFIIYRCLLHWHIANKNPDKRTKTRLKDRRQCFVCDVALNGVPYWEHRGSATHKALVRELHIYDE